MSDLLKSVIQDLINDRTEQAQVSIHDYIVGKTQQIAGLTEARGMSLADAMKATKSGEKADAALTTAMKKLCLAAEKKGLQLVLDGDVEVDATAKEIRNGAIVTAQHVLLHEKNIFVEINIDLDDIGGDSRNHETIEFDLEGKNPNRVFESGQDPIAEFEVGFEEGLNNWKFTKL